MAAISLTNVAKRYPGADAVAIEEISLTIEENEFFVLLGPSGCGKSTLLKLVAGLEEPTGGTVDFDGRCVNYVPPAKRNVAMVFQNYGLYPHMSARRNICFPLKMRKTGKAEIATSCEAVAQALNLWPVLDRGVSELSGGERQRVALGRAIIRRPDVMLMDEPLSNLDALLRVQTREELMRLHRAFPTTVLYVTHDQVEAMTMADRIGIMDAGRIVQVGRPEEVYRSPATQFVAGFLGSPPMSFLTGRVEEGNGGARFAATELEIELGERMNGTRGDGITMGVRPEHVRVDPSGSGRAGRWTVELVEALGAEQIISLVSPAGRLRARLDPSVDVKEGIQVGVDFELADTRFFRADGYAISRRS